MIKKKKTILIISIFMSLSIITSGLSTFLVLANRNKSEEIIIKSLDNQVSLFKTF